MADVFVFWSVVPEDMEIPAILARLDSAERISAARFHFAADRNAYAVAHALLRYGLDSLGGVRPWRFRQLPGGKPVIADDLRPGLHFSLSHSRRLCAVAISRDGALGIDVEAVAGARTLDDVAAIAFSHTEQAMLRTLSDAPRREAFFTLWTLKEAAIKATGQGLSADLATFSFSLDPLCLMTPGPDGSRRENWYFQSTRIHECRLAVALLACPGLDVGFHLAEVPPDLLGSAAPVADQTPR